MSSASSATSTAILGRGAVLAGGRRLAADAAAGCLLPAEPKEARPRRPLPGFYLNSLSWALDHRLVSCILGLVIFVTSIVLAVAVVPKGLQPEENPNFYQLDVQTPPGSTVDDTRQAVARVADLLKSQQETQHVFTALGGSGGGGPNGRAASRRHHRRSRWRCCQYAEGVQSSHQILHRLRPLFHDIPDARVTIEGNNFGGATVAVPLVSDSGVGLDAAARWSCSARWPNTHTLADPRPATEPPSPEVIIRPRPDDAARLGVSADTLAQVARVATVGDIDANVAKLDLGDRRIPIRVRLPESARTDLPTLKNLRVPTASGGLTTLDSVADVYFQAGPAQITRYNRRDEHRRSTPTLRNGAKLSDGLSPRSRKSADFSTDHLPPPGWSTRPTSPTSRRRTSCSRASAWRSSSGIGLVYGVMVLLFESFFKPVTILLALPLSVAGAMVGLLLWHSELSIPSMIGLFMLMWHRGQELLILYCVRVRHRTRARRRQPARRPDGSLPRTRPADRDDHPGHDGRHAAHGDGHRRRLRVPPAHGRYGFVIGGAHHLDLALPGAGVPVVYEIVDDFKEWREAAQGQADHAAGSPGRGAGRRGPSNQADGGGIAAAELEAAPPRAANATRTLFFVIGAAVAGGHKGVVTSSPSNGSGLRTAAAWASMLLSLGVGSILAMPAAGKALAARYGCRRGSGLRRRWRSLLPSRCWPCCRWSGPWPRRSSSLAPASGRPTAWSTCRPSRWSAIAASR